MKGYRYIVEITTRDEAEEVDLFVDSQAKELETLLVDAKVKYHRI